MQPRLPGQQQQLRLVRELLPLLQPRAVVSAAAGSILFMRSCAGVHESAAPAVQDWLEAQQQQQVQLVAAAEEDSSQCLGQLRQADRLRRAAGRQAADEASQLRQRQWRDLRRTLTSGRGLWADEERPEGEAAACRPWRCGVLRSPAAACCCCFCVQRVWPYSDPALIPRCACCRPALEAG